MNISKYESRLLPEMNPSDPVVWVDHGTYQEARLGDPDNGDGVVFTRQLQPTCYRRGPHFLQIIIASGWAHNKWGCFDGQDRPERNYHNLEALEMEVASLARVLVTDRLKAG